MSVYRPVCHFFRALVQPEYSAVTDVYVLMFLADTVDFIIIVFGFWAFGVNLKGLRCCTEFCFTSVLCCQLSTSSFPSRVNLISHWGESSWKRNGSWLSVTDWALFTCLCKCSEIVGLYFQKHSAAADITSSLSEDQVPEAFLVMVLIQFGTYLFLFYICVSVWVCVCHDAWLCSFLSVCLSAGTMVIDRALYLRKTVLGKLVFQVILVFGIHFWMFFILPTVTER